MGQRSVCRDVFCSCYLRQLRIRQRAQMFLPSHQYIFFSMYRVRTTSRLQEAPECTGEGLPMFGAAMDNARMARDACFEELGGEARGFGRIRTELDFFVFRRWRSRSGDLGSK